MNLYMATTPHRSFTFTRKEIYLNVIRGYIYAITDATQKGRKTLFNLSFLVKAYN